MIDLRNAEKPVRELIGSSLSSFEKEQPDLIWSSFALYSCPRAGWILACFDTVENSDKGVAEFAKNGPDWYGEDAWGRFSDSCPDFQFNEWRVLEIDQWRDAYEEAETRPLQLTDLNSQVHQIGGYDGDEALNGIVFDFLRAVLLKQSGELRSDPSLMQSRRRCGVQMLDSKYVEFWRLEPSGAGGR